MLYCIENMKSGAWCWLSGALFFFLLTLGAPMAVNAAVADTQSPLRLPDKLDGFDLFPHLSYWYDPAPRSSLDIARDSLQQGRFDSMRDSPQNFGFSSGTHWFHLVLESGRPAVRLILIELDYPVLDQVDFFCQGDEGSAVYFPAGDQLQFESRVVKVRNFVIPLELKPLVATDCMIRIRSQSNLLLPIQAFDVLPYIEKNQRMDWALGIFYGLALALVLYNFVIWFLTRESLHLFFVLHVLGGLVYASTMDGTMIRIWLALDFQDVGMAIGVFLSVAFGILFGMEYLELRRTWNAAYRGGMVFVALMILFSLLALVVPVTVAYIATATFAPLVALYLLALGIKRWRDGYAPALFYVVGYGGVFLMVAWMCLNVLVLRDDVRFITYGMSSAWLCELLFLSLGLGYRIRMVQQKQLSLSRQMEQVVQESNTKTEFMAKISHEVRTPMNGIMGLVELLLSTPLDHEQQRYLNAIQHAGKGLQEVINDVLEFSRIEAGKLTLSPAPFELESLVQDACAIYEFEARNKRIELGGLIAEGTPLRLVGDVNRIRQVLLNLLSNALKYTEQGFVHINVQLTDQILSDKLVLRFEVEDSGVGITAQDQHKLFQIFSQLGIGHHQRSGGSGLGLVISQQIVELMGGEMGVQSEYGRGSCFWFTLPLELADQGSVADRDIVLDLFAGASALPLKANGARKSSAEAGRLSSSRVLVVEDNAINQSVMSGFLQRLDLQVDFADNGRTAVEMVQQGQPYDLILMDCEMPVMDGYEAAGRILKGQRTAGVPLTPIIALSAHALDKHRDMARAAGMVDYLVKPVGYKQLVDKIGIYIDLPADAWSRS